MIAPRASFSLSWDIHKKIERLSDIHSMLAFRLYWDVHEKILVVSSVSISVRLLDYYPVLAFPISHEQIFKNQTGSLRKQWLESVQMSQIYPLTFICVPSHPGVRGVKEQNSWSTLLS